MEDRDVPFSHWLVYNIPPEVSSLPEGIIQQPQLENGALQGLNDNAEIGYIGPFPPPGETHRYAFILCALDAPLTLGPGAVREQVLAAMEGHILATAELVGTYTGVEP
jgi:Raf kinase inhibitor-like YbhB/YbcL family protein